MLRRVYLQALAILLMAAIHVSAEPLKKGDRIVFLGDSITQAGAGPGGYVTLVREELSAKHKDLGIEVIGAGISGNKVPDLEKRLDQDVLEKKPSIVVIYIGINDVWHSQNGKGTSAEAFEKGLKSLIERISKAGARTILCTATVIGEKTDGSNKLDKMLDEYCDISRKVAKDTGTQLIDLRTACLAHLKANNKENKSKGILTSDEVHLSGDGNKFIAAQMVQGLTGAASPGGANKGKLLRHVVCFKFKADVTKEQIKEVEEAFAQLPKKIDAIESFEWGNNNSPEMLDKGFTHCWLVTFRDEKGRETYLPHADHLKFVDLVKPKLEDVFVFDYWTP